ncbi:hypothetical protein LL13C18_19070 [Escherichia coli]
MSTITKERIELFIKSPLENGLTRGEQMELARIALASLEAEPVAWMHSDNGLGIPAITRSKNVADSWLSKGWYVQPLYIAKPVPVVPDARPSLNNGIVGFDEGWNACRAAMLQGADGNSPVIAKAYDIEAFGVFSATEGKNGLLLQIEQFWFGTENCPQIGKENMVPKFALQAIINRLQAHCNSMGEDTLIDIFASSAAPQQEDK